MVELYFLLIRIPRMMSRLARERNRSAWKWSLLGIAVWLGAEFGVAFGFGIGYAIGTMIFDWPPELPTGFRIVTYITALLAAIISVTIVRKILVSRSTENQLPSPPPPPRFNGLNLT